jgi:Pyridoxamine 5'-phosphate oxidase
VAKLSDNEAQLFLDKNFGAVGTLREDGSPLLTPVWVDDDGENVVFNTSPSYQGHKPGERRVIVRVKPERVFSKDVG